MTATTATLLDVQYTPHREECGSALPESVWGLDDGRILAVYPDGREQLYGSVSWMHSAHSFERTHPVIQVRHTQERRLVDAPPISTTYVIQVDWAAIHHAAAEVDRVRCRSDIGRVVSITDAFGGTYAPEAHRGLIGLLKISRGTSRIAEDAWHIVHQATRKGLSVDVARQACRVAVACSRLFALLHEAGIIPDPSHRICGTGPGYGLTGLHWLAGATTDDGATTEEVDRFVATGELPDVSRCAPTRAEESGCP